MNMPRFTAEASLYKTSEHYQFVASWIEGTGGQGIIPQQDFIPATPLPPFFRCSPCMLGRQFCCPPPGFGLRCFVRRCWVPL
ncbi:hypothetical protein BH20PSE1_BH20PSE1_23930 [soil metagenome]